jgi:hypothetical protein
LTEVLNFGFFDFLRFLDFFLFFLFLFLGVRGGVRY